MIRIIRFQSKHSEATSKFILDILEGEFGIVGEERPDLYRIPEVYQKRKSNFWLAMDGGEVVGTVALVDYGKSRGYLKRMYVGKKFRGTLLAKRLLETVLAFARMNAIREIYAGTVPEMAAANKFYQKHGFKKIEELPPDFPEFGDTIFYSLTL